MMSQSMPGAALEPDGTIPIGYQPISSRTWLMNRVGKRAAGRCLDGREWNEFPGRACNSERSDRK